MAQVVNGHMVQALIERTLAGDEDAARELHDLHYPATLRLAYLLLQNQDDAEDATQEAFWYAFNNLERFDPHQASFATWLKIIVTGRCRDIQRRRRRARWLSLQKLLEAGYDPEDEVASHRPETALELVGVQQMVWEALEQVPRKARQALILRYFGGLSYPEMALALGCTVSTAKSRVAYGHQVLAHLLEQKAQFELSYSTK
ncbi:MAG: sigma-70 family RNA polymerase sigma factor [Anaerolineae bacterium]|nr:sigma-70 family RNA polymerase sigma factor [Anaerolineae bacterium]